ncbi:hypothetical protein Sango_1764100 [Sesamum angolense]|uniref:Methyltransferase type 11 domain-containing protein n=1 Tax=Sesamum angolense TaxID=2727404 RepID=A0AAE1WGG2_9LAMI|nr:hypothetical protein Sango_1764100 [Sesamum angolense]
MHRINTFARIQNGRFRKEEQYVFCLTHQGTKEKRFPPKNLQHSRTKPEIKQLITTQAQWQNQTPCLSPENKAQQLTQTEFYPTCSDMWTTNHYTFKQRQGILRPKMEFLISLSSWISHLPQEVKYKKVVGHGLNAQELARNPRLDYFFVKDLNKEQELQMENGSLMLFYAPSVFAELFRVLRPGGVFIVSFSNRLFYEKAVSAWRDGTAYSRVQLVVQYFQCVEGFTQPQVIRRLPNAKEDNSIFSRLSGLLGLLSGSDPFYAVIAYKNFKPIYE